MKKHLLAIALFALCTTGLNAASPKKVAPEKKGETDSNDVFYVRVDRTRKVPITVLIRALGIGTRRRDQGAFSARSLRF